MSGRAQQFRRAIGRVVHGSRFQVWRGLSAEAFERRPQHVRAIAHRRNDGDQRERRHGRGGQNQAPKPGWDGAGYPSGATPVSG